MSTDVQWNPYHMKGKLQLALFGIWVREENICKVSLSLECIFCMVESTSRRLGNTT
jgi:hypothetical protein